MARISTRRKTTRRVSAASGMKKESFTFSKTDQEELGLLQQGAGRASRTDTMRWAIRKLAEQLELVRLGYIVMAQAPGGGAWVALDLPPLPRPLGRAVPGVAAVRVSE